MDKEREKEEAIALFACEFDRVSTVDPSPPRTETL